MLFTALLNCTIHLGWFFKPPSLISLSKTSVSHSLSVIAFTLAVYFSERWKRFYNRVVVSADTRNRTLITILLVREISNLLWYHYTISANESNGTRTRTRYLSISSRITRFPTPPRKWNLSNFGYFAFRCFWNLWLRPASVLPRSIHFELLILEHLTGIQQKVKHQSNHGFLIPIGYLSTLNSFLLMGERIKLIMWSWEFYSP